MSALKRLYWLNVTLITGFYLLIGPAQPLVAQAQVAENSAELLTATTVVQEDSQAQKITNFFESWDDLSWISEAEGRLALAPQDQNELRKCEAGSSDCKVDVRVIDYLKYLVAPTEEGGQGLTRIRAGRLLKNYNTKGIGRFDRETLDSLEEDNSLLSSHYDGKAVDISEVGSITCKLIEKRYLGGNKTRFQPPQPVKVAWQSRDGISRLPTPTGESLLSVAGSMSADSIVRYLNESGEMDAAVDYARGLDLETILSYVGANILLKNYDLGQVKDDPLSASLIQTIGLAAFKKNLPGLPEGISAGNEGENVAVVVAKARIEQSLGLPPGSLRQNGWEGILVNSGKRSLERSLGLPTLYLEDHSLEQLTTQDAIAGVLTYVGRADDSFNFTPGTIEKIRAKDPTGYKLAGIAVIANALKLSPENRKKLEDAVVANQTPSLDTTDWPIGDNIVPLDTITNLFSADQDKQKLAADELKNIGLDLLRQAAAKAVPSKYAGLTQKLLNDILFSRQGIKLDDLGKKLGSATVLAEAGADATKSDQLIKNPGNSNARLVAEQINSALSLTDSSLLSAGDIERMFKRGDLSVVKKIGASQADRAIGWNDGTALKVINKEKPLAEAIEEVFANTVSNIIGLEKGTLSIKDKDSRRQIANAYMEKRFGLRNGALKDKKTPQEIIQAIGSAKSIQLFGSDLTKPGAVDQPNTITRLEDYDRQLGLEMGTLRGYFKDEVSESELVKKIAVAQVAKITPEKLWDYFDLDEQFRIDGKEVTNIITVLGGGEEVTVEQQQTALNSIYKLIGRTVDSRTGFPLDDFKNYFLANNDADRTKALLDTGLKVFAKSIGVNVDNLSIEQLEATGAAIKQVFNQGTSALEEQRQEYEALIQKGGERGEKLSGDERARLAELRNDQTLQAYRNGTTRVVEFFLQATGIPAEFRVDANNFVGGDYRSGLAAASFVVWEKSVNPFLPADGQLTYNDLRQTIVFDDQKKIDERVDAIVKRDDPNATVTSGQRAALRGLARKELMEEAKKSAEFKISDSFLRKADPTIPAGFSRVMFEGTEAEKAATLEKWAFNHLDQALKNADSSYKPGTLEAIYKGTADQRQALIVQEIARRAGITIGPISADDVFNYVTYLSSPLNERNNFYTDQKYASMWTSVDSWLGSSLGLGGLPTGLSKSLYLASQNNWDFSQEIKDADGKLIVASVNSLGEQFLTNRLSAWGDQQFNLPPGTILRTYQAVKAVGDASRALEVAKAAGDSAKLSQASKGLSQAQASLTVLAITTALSLCQGCQELFGTVDRALAAPPGFTNAAVAGAVAMAFGLGPAGLYIAAAIYLFGVYKVEYLCPMPPKDPFAVAGFDKEYDQLNYGYNYDPNVPVKTNPKPGENPFDWDNGVAFDDGNNPELWMGWARYFTGQLLDSSMAYGAAQTNRDKPRQIMTLRQANTEFFSPLSESTFGEYEKNNKRVGLGYTQDSTKTTDWVHVGFGGLF